MKYGLVICPSCGRARGVETSRKTTSCSCGRRVKLRRSMIKFETDSPKELAEMVGQANEQLSSGKKFRRRKAKESEDPFVRVARACMTLKDPVQRGEAIARGLTDELGEFGLDELRRVLAVLGSNDPEDLVRRLTEANMVYEVGGGRYRAV
ncbi:MAG: DUF1922 domain-containing protein [Methanobacteriota archaeon]|nr:MAG: DUF1922 domain-containing protein [Euryarchaeota archaeon]